MTARLGLLTATTLVAMLCIQVFARTERVPARRPLSELPVQLDGWSAIRQETIDPVVVAELGTDEYVSRTYARSSVQADLFIGYYESQRQGDTIHSPLNCLPGTGWTLADLNRATISDGAGSTMIVNRGTIERSNDRRVMYYWYQSHGRTIASEYWRKAYTVLDSIRLHRTDGALVRIITPIAGDERAAADAATAFIASLYPTLDRFLPE
jgi:EpsI family protein